MPFTRGHKGCRTKESYDKADRSFMQTQEYRDKMKALALERGYGKWMIGRPMPDKTRAAIRKAVVGRFKENPLTPINKRIRTGPEWKRWRKAVFERDNYTCQFCGARGGVELNPDHIKPFALYPELRFDVDNGRTLCRPCHMKTETWGYRKMYRKAV